MMINLVTVLMILAIHYFADFILQTDWQARNKSSNNQALTDHVGTYAMVWIVPMFIIFSFGVYKMDAFLLALLFAFITFVMHWITDYFTSRLNLKLWTEGKTHLFFVSLGFDQLLHFTQLLVTFYLLRNI